MQWNRIGYYHFKAKKELKMLFIGNTPNNTRNEKTFAFVYVNENVYVNFPRCSHTETLFHQSDENETDFHVGFYTRNGFFVKSI